MNTINWQQDGYGQCNGAVVIPEAATFTCPHLSIGNVVAASCGICGPLTASA